MVLNTLALFQSGLTCMTLIQRQDMKCKLDIFSPDVFSNGMHWSCSPVNSD